MFPILALDLGVATPSKETMTSTSNNLADKCTICLNPLQDPTNAAM